MIVAVSCDRRAFGPKPDSHRVRPARAEVFLKACIVDKLRQTGLQPILLAPDSSAETIEWVAEHCAGIVVTGGAFDIDPRWYGQAVAGRIDHIDEGRTQMEMQLATVALERQIPMLGICGGMQVLAVVAGGTLIQDIATAEPTALEHEQPTDPAEAWHDVHLVSPKWQRWYGSDTIRVNSTHHQAVDQLGQCIVTGRANDGMIESIEIAEHPFCVGVQWHPELLLDDAIFMAFSRAIQDPS